jgi:hypothetical protein
MIKFLFVIEWKPFKYTRIRVYIVEKLVSMNRVYVLGNKISTYTKLIQLCCHSLHHK